MIAQNHLTDMKVKALIQSHYPERRVNLNIMVDSLLKNGIKAEDIMLLIDYPGYDFNGTLKVLQSNSTMPINWWHGVASLLDCDYVALLCDDLFLKPKSIDSLALYAIGNPDIDVLGYEGGKFGEKAHPYTTSGSHTVSKFEEADYLIRFYFGKPLAFAKALELYNKLAKDKAIHDDLLLSLSNKCGLVPTTSDSGWEELSEEGVAYSKRSSHYQERDDLIKEVKNVLHTD